MSASRSPARLLAPIALVAVLVAVFAVYRGTLGEEPARTGGEQTTTTGTQTGTGTGTTQTDTADEGEDAPPETYTVESGDSLGAIAEETGVPVERIVQLNEDVDPQSLQTGQELRLSP